ncbi:MAG: hypothetical protein ABI591_19110 [Kofleriaceae bacterium]
MRRALLIAALVGCSGGADDGAALGESCDLKTPCASGGVCDYTLAAPICIDANADTDGDGLINMIDHCPDGPGGMFDEDQDGIGDDCDKCPIAKPPAVPDRDGDDVDSPCDPDPDTAGDKILLFDGFNGPGLGSNWTADTASAGAWTVEGGELVVRLPTQAAQAYLTTTVISDPNVAVQTSYRVDSLGTGSPLHSVTTLAKDTRPAGVAEFECGAVKSDTGAGDEVVDLNTDQATVSNPSIVPAFNSASLYRSAAYASGSTVECVVIGDNMQLAAMQSAITPDALGTVRLSARGVTARYQWVLVIGRSNTPPPP